jgi:hypothetical protein
MNEEIERVLRKTPQPKVPAGLLEKLQADIVLPRKEPTRSASVDGWRPLLKRWLPALSFAAFLLASLVAIGVQANVLAELRRENRELQVAAAGAEQVQRENSNLQAAEQLRLEQLRKDAAEVERLRAEIAQLQATSQELANLRKDNQQLKARLEAVTRSMAAGGIGEEDPFGAAREKARSIQCVSNMKQIGLGARMWANDHQEILPPDFITMQHELNTPKILVCPSDEGRARATSWAEFGPANVSYEFLAPTVSEGESPYTVMTRCPIHDHVGFLDGSVHQGAWKRAVQKNGRWVVEANAQRP